MLEKPGVMTFSDACHSDSLMKSLESQRKERHFCDAIFLVQNQEFPVHRNVLAASSPYFDSILRSDCTSSTMMEPITVDCNSQVFEILVDYIYTGTIKIDMQTVEELSQLSQRFLISRLKLYCSEYLEKQLTVTNCFRIKHLAHNCNLRSLEKAVDSYLLANIADVLKQDEILFFSESKIQDFVVDKSLPLREELKIHVINRWVHQATRERQQYYQPLLRLVTWDKVHLAGLNAILNEEHLYKTSELCFLLMLNILEEQGLLSAANKTTQEELITKYSLGGSLSREMNLSKNMSCANNLPVSKQIKVQDVVSETLTSTELVQDSDVASDAEEYRGKSQCWQIREEGFEESQHQTENDFRLRNNRESRVELTNDDKLLLPVKKVKSKSESLGKNTNKSTYLKRKRKGIPVKINSSLLKVQIPESDTNNDVDTKRKRGRPPKTRIKKAKNKIANPPLYVEDLDNITMRGITDDECHLDVTTCDSNMDVLTEGCPSERVNISVDQKQKGTKHTAQDFASTEDTSDDDDCAQEPSPKLRKKKVYSCPLCQFHTLWNKDYSDHVKGHFPGPPYTCDFSCGYSAAKLQQVLHHRMSHTDDKPYQCTICNLSFRSRKNLTMHAHSHTGVKPFTCDVCDRSFATKGTLVQHSVTHSDLRPYLCDMCGFSTKYQSHLIAHKRIHSGDVFKCQHPNCRYSTPKRSQLACHMRTHMSIRSHVCSTCGRAFVEKSHLVRHEKIHLEEKPFKCDHCEYSSTRRDKLKDHTSRYHPTGVGGTTPKTPYRARKTRRPAAQPSVGLSSEEAAQELATLLQQSDALRQQQQSHKVTCSQNKLCAGVGGLHSVFDSLGQAVTQASQKNIDDINSTELGPGSILEYGEIGDTSSLLAISQVIRESSNGGMLSQKSQQTPEPNNTLQVKDSPHQSNVPLTPGHMATIVGTVGCATDIGSLPACLCSPAQSVPVITLSSAQQITGTQQHHNLDQRRTPDISGLQTFMNILTD